MLHRALMGVSPRHMAVVIRRAGQRRVEERLVPTLRPYEHRVCRHTIIAACHKGRDTLGDVERLAREVLRHILEPIVMVVETYDVEGV